MGGRMYDANLCFVGMIKGIAKLAKGEIMERSRKNIDKKLHDNFMITEQEVADFTKAADIKDKNEPQFFVLDKDGKIIYHTAGEYSDKKLNELTEKLMYWEIILPLNNCNIADGMNRNEYAGF